MMVDYQVSSGHVSKEVSTSVEFSHHAINVSEESDLDDVDKAKLPCNLGRNLDVNQGKLISGFWGEQLL